MEDKKGGLRMKRNTPVLLTILLAVVLVAPLIIAGCTGGAITTTQTITQTTTSMAQATTITETAPATTVTQTAPATTIIATAPATTITATAPATTSTITTTITEASPPESTTATITTTVTMQPVLDQIIAALSPQEAFDLIQANLENPKFMIIDVRGSSDARTSDGYIEGDVVFPLQSGFNTAVQSKDKCGTYLIYCVTGRQSGEAQDIMKEMGFFEVYSLDGGIRNWLAQEFPVLHE